MAVSNIRYSTPKYPEKLPEQEFEISGTLENECNLSLRFNYVLFSHGLGEVSVSNTLPLRLELIEVNRARKIKRGDFYLFSDYHTNCLNHSSCQTNFGLPLHEQTLDRDTSRLIEMGSLISQMLSESKVPEPLSNHWIIGALRDNNLSEVVDRPYVLRGLRPSCRVSIVVR